MKKKIKGARGLLMSLVSIVYDTARNHLLSINYSYFADTSRRAVSTGYQSTSSQRCFATFCLSESSPRPSTLSSHTG